MEIVKYIVAVLFAIVAAIIFGLYVSFDIIAVRKYKNSYKADGRVISYNGIFKSANYGKHQPSTIYYSYTVEFIAGENKCSGTYLSKYKGMKLGDIVEVHYVRSSDGHVEIVNSDIKDRLYRFLVCAAVGVGFSLIYILFFK